MSVPWQTTEEKQWTRAPSLAWRVYGEKYPTKSKKSLDFLRIQAIFAEKAGVHDC